ncbi:MAG: L-threonylcarbamoyladenylate synthase [Eubacteriales bacterium]|nr:L-threonylcarbamoyladenylate synthase [Eubacteriales bacterium]
MQTVEIVVDQTRSLEEIDRLLLPAAACLQAGGLVAFPTETVYGLGANALDPQAVAAIFTAKGRPGDNPLIVHVASIADILPLTTEMTPLAEALLASFSPGPLTLILPRSNLVPDLVTAGLDTVAVRIPAHPIARRLIELAGVPVAAPSANRSGKPSPTRAWHVQNDLEGVIPYIIDGGACEYGLESTVLDLTGPVPIILRPGAISAEAIDAAVESFLNSSKPQGVTQSAFLQMKSASPATIDQHIPRSPGMKYRHYAPVARLIICDQATPTLRAQAMTAWLSANQPLYRDERIGIYCSLETYALIPENIRHKATVSHPVAPASATSPATTLDDLTFLVHLYAKKAEPEAASHHLFDALRTLDRQAVKVIVAEGLPPHGAGAAYMNRLRKAAGGGEAV